MSAKFLKNLSAQIVLATAALVLGSLPVTAAEELVISVPGPGRDIRISTTDVVEFVEEDYRSRRMEAYFDDERFSSYFSEANINAIRNGLGLEVKVTFNDFFDFLKSEDGAYLLGVIARFIKPSAGIQGAEFQAIRGALIGAAEDDSLSIVEIIEEYPTTMMVVDHKGITAPDRSIRNSWIDIFSCFEMQAEDGSFAGKPFIDLRKIDYQAVAENCPEFSTSQTEIIED